MTVGIQAFSAIENELPFVLPASSHLGRGHIPVVSVSEPERLPAAGGAAAVAE